MRFSHITQELASALLNQSVTLQSKPIWYSSLLNWPQYLIGDNQGTVLCTKLEDSDEMVDRIRVELGLEGELIVQHYIWLPRSAILPHQDDHVRAGITIYLTNEQDNSCGKLFYMDEVEKSVTPRAGLVAINDNRAIHWVTPVDHYAIRRTVQIWVN